ITAPTVIYTLSLHDALPISESSPRCDPGILKTHPKMDPGAYPAKGGWTLESRCGRSQIQLANLLHTRTSAYNHAECNSPRRLRQDRKSTRLNSSHVASSYAV